MRRLLARALRLVLPHTTFHHRANGPVVIDPEKPGTIHVWGKK